MNYQVGAARIEMKHDAVGVVMMGWGDENHVIQGSSTPLYARAVFISEPKSGRRLVLICMDICFITEALRLKVIDELRLQGIDIRDDEIILSATHTHSAPGGFSSYVVYSLSTSGFVPRIFDSYVLAAVQATTEAFSRLEPSAIRFAAGEFDLSKPVAFNRSIRAWNRNPDVQKRTRKERHLAVDREMQLLRFDRADGTPIALWNWFAVHCTSIHRDRYNIHSDNKGIASIILEKQFRNEKNPNFVSVFSQGAAGDVSPNFQYHLGLREKRGTDRDDEVSCEANALLQANQAKEIFEKAASTPELEANLEGIFEYQDLSSIEIPPELVDGKLGCRTGLAEIGMPQLRGTAEGRGAPFPTMLFLTVLIRISQLYNYVVDRISGKKTFWPWRDHPIQGNKITIIASGRSEILETSRIHKLAIPGWIHPTIGNLKRWGRRGILKERPFTPQVLPIQLSRLGGLVIASVPAEFSTQAGVRLKRHLTELLKTKGFDRVIIQGYANAYSSYVVTPEEYNQQGYEGGCTHFGRWTLPAYIKIFRELARKLNEKGQANSLRPRQPTPEYWSAIKNITERKSDR